MTSIPDIMKTISRDIQQAFEELMKLLLRKTLRPTLNPLGQNTKIVYNSFRQKYERGFIGTSPDDNINKYNYILTNDSLGWTDDILATFRVLAKFIKNTNVVPRFPAGHAKLRNSILSKSHVAFSERETKTHSERLPVLSQYKNFLKFLASRSMQHIIANKQASFSYMADIPYSQSFKQLESIGRDIIDQTDPSIEGGDSAKMSTSMLRVKLYTLDKELGDLSVNHCEIFESYIEMLRLINSVPRGKIICVINLIALLSFDSWDNIDPKQQKIYVDALGEEFLTAFNSNELITILLQSNSSELILANSYLFPLLKMLFIVFGFSKLVPLVVDKTNSIAKAMLEEKMKRHMDKYRGAFYRRGDDNAADIEPSADENRVPDPRLSDCEPVDPCIYDFIKLFGDLYPTIIGLMGGTETFPPECIAVDCGTIPATYNGLTSLPEYFWRFNDYSYCHHLEYVNAKLVKNALASKVNAKARYLQTI